MIVQITSINIKDLLQISQLFIKEKPLDLYDIFP